MEMNEVSAAHGVASLAEILSISKELANYLIDQREQNEAPAPTITRGGTPYWDDNGLLEWSKWWIERVRRESPSE